MTTMARKLGRARTHSPVEMEVAYVQAMWEATDLDDTEEVQTLFFVGKDIVKGTRSIDDFFLDWADMTWCEASETQKVGWEIRPVASKNNREQRDKPIGLPCVTGCTGNIRHVRRRACATACGCTRRVACCMVSLCGPCGAHGDHVCSRTWHERATRLRLLSRGDGCGLEQQ